MRCFKMLSILWVFFCSFSFGNFSLKIVAKMIAPDVYVILTPSRTFPNLINQGWNSNSTFVITKAGVILFDTGSSYTIGESIKKTISEVTDQPVRWLINSHSHGDHWLGNGAFKDTVKKIYASEKVAGLIADTGKTWVNNFKQMTNGITGDSVILPPNSFINETTKIELGDKKIIFLLSGNSHSSGDILLWLEDEKVLITGDVVYSDRMPSTTESDLLQWIKYLDELAALEPKVVIPGHGDITDLEGLIRLKSLLQAFWSAVESGYEDDKSSYEIVPDVIKALSKFKDSYPGMNEKIIRDTPRVFLQVEAANF